jgi:tRNA modification GTPase
LADIDGFRITLIDTAGERAADDPVDEIESAGLDRARGARSVADLVLVVLDRSRPLDEVDRSILTQTTDMRRVIVINKCDLPDAWTEGALAPQSLSALPVSVRTRQGLDRLRAAIACELGAGAVPGGDVPRDTVAVTNVRHIELLDRARTALARARQAIDVSHGTLSEEFVLADLQDARNAFEEITGRRTADDVLHHIFGRFCIGK